MNRDQKAAVVDEIAEQIQSAEAIFAVDYRGLTVSQAAELRGKLRDADARFRIVKNSLSERAADKAGADALKPLLVGPTALALVRGDAAVAAKALNDSARAFNLLEFKGGVLNGETLSADDVRSIARLPSRDVLNAQLVGTIAAPISGLVRTLNALIAGVAIQLQAIADQGLVSGEAPAAPAAEAPAAEARRLRLRRLRRLRLRLRRLRLRRLRRLRLRLRRLRLRRLRLRRLRLRLRRLRLRLRRPRRLRPRPLSPRLRRRTRLNNPNLKPLTRKLPRTRKRPTRKEERWLPQKSGSTN